MVSLDEARTIARTVYDDLCDEVNETPEYWIFDCDTNGAVTAGGGDPVAVSKTDGSVRLLLLVLDKSWAVLDSATPVAATG